MNYNVKLIPLLVVAFVILLFGYTYVKDQVGLLESRVNGLQNRIVALEDK